MGLFTYSAATTHICLFVIVLIAYTKIVYGYTECPNTLETWRQMEAELSCQGNTYAHCLRDDEMKILRKCSTKSWIQSGYCPEYNNHAAMIDIAPCDIHRGKCPDKTYWSNEVYLFSACWKIGYSTIIQESTTTSFDRNTEPQNTDGSSSESTPIILIAVAASVLIIIAVVLIVVCKRRGRGEENASTNPEESFPLNSETTQTTRPQNDPSSSRHDSRNGSALINEDVSLNRSSPDTNIEYPRETVLDKPINTVPCSTRRDVSNDSVSNTNTLGQNYENIISELMTYIQYPPKLAIVSSDNSSVLQTICEYVVQSNGNAVRIDSFYQWKSEDKSSVKYLVLDCFDKVMDVSVFDLSIFKAEIEQIHKDIKDYRIGVLTLIPTSLYQLRKRHIDEYDLFKSVKVFEL